MAEMVDLPGNRCMKTLTILSIELKTKLHLQTISAHANGPCCKYYMIQNNLRMNQSQQDGTDVPLNQLMITSANEKQTMKSFSFLG